MKWQARRRPDLREEGTLIPVKMVGKEGVKHVEFDEWADVHQPDILDDAEYGLLIFSNTKQKELVAVGNVVDFEYREVKEDRE